MAKIDKIARQLSYNVRTIHDFEKRYGTRALLRERQDLLKALKPIQHIERLSQLENAVRTAFVNPFEELIRSIRPSLEDLRLEIGFHPNTIRSIQLAAENLARPSDIMQQVATFKGLGHSSIDRLIRGQLAIDERVLEIRNNVVDVEIPDLFPHHRIAGALAGIQVLSEQSEVMRFSAKTALESIQAFQSFAKRQLRRAVIDEPNVFSRRMAVTDLAGDLLETAQSSWEMLGQQATAVPDNCPPVMVKPAIYSHLNQELSYLYRKDVKADPHSAYHRSTASRVATLGGEIVELIYNINQSRMSSANAHIFKPTNRALRAIYQLTNSVSRNEQSFGDVVDALYILIYEGSGSASRLTDLMTDAELTTVWWIKTLRTSMRHDVDHGDERKSRKKHSEIGEVYYALVGQMRPKLAADWSAAQVVLYEYTADLLRSVLDIVDPN